MKGLKLFTFAFFTYLFLMVCANIFLKDRLYAVALPSHKIMSALIIALIFWGALVLGYLKPIRFPEWVYWLLIFILSFALPIYGQLAVLVMFLLSREYNVFEKHAKFVLLGSILSILVLYSFEGIPFFQWGLRFRLVKPLVLFAFLSGISLTYCRLNWKLKILALLILEVLFFLGTFRSLMLLVFLFYILPYYYENKLTFKQVLVALPIFLVVIYLSGNLESLLVRVGFTFLVFHNIVSVSLPFGFFHGKLLFHSDPRWRVAFMFTLNGRYTYFLFGQPIADFGIFGVIEAYLIGNLLKLSEVNKKTASIVLATLIYALESGIDAFVLSVLLLFGGVYSRYTSKG
ncbi:hypothetical protein DRN51_04360 [Thermococci archaeon]|nr:MAG: hypothetical protein DRN51_04360 [Thermococci archaeon]